jgi:hypothetical protein
LSAIEGGAMLDAPTDKQTSLIGEN